MTRRIDAVRPMDYRHPALFERHAFRPARLLRVQCRHCRTLFTAENRVASPWTDSKLSPYCRDCHALITAPIVPRHVQEARLSATWSRYARTWGSGSPAAMDAHLKLLAYQASAPEGWTP